MATPKKGMTNNFFSTQKSNTKSTKKNRDILRANAMSEILISGISKISLSAQIPLKFSQVLLTGFSFFTQDLKPHEYMIQGTHFAIALVQTTLMIALFITGKEVIATFTLISRILVLCEMLYQGVLIASWAPSELSKEEEPIPLPSSTASPLSSTQPKEDTSQIDFKLN